MKNKRQLKPLGKRSVSTWPHASTLREFMTDCGQRGQTVSVRLRQILDEYYSNERLKAIGRDVVETPIRRVQREAISEELVPLKNRVAEIEKGVQATRSIVEDILGQIAQIALGTTGISPEFQENHFHRLELAISQLANYTIQLGNGNDGAGGNDQDHVPLYAQVMKRLDEMQALTSKLVLRVLRDTVRTAVKAEIKTGHILRVRVDPETGVEIYAEFKTVEKVTNPEIELTPEDAWRRYGMKAQLGSKVFLRLHEGVDAVRVIARAANEFLQRG